MQSNEPEKVKMATTNLTLNKLAKKYSEETKARELLESLRWPSGAACPRCGSLDVSKITRKAGSKNPVREGVYRCKDCRKNKTKDQFTVTVGTIFEDSHIPLSKWLLAITFLCSSKKGVSAHQVHRMLGITYKSAWFMMHRIRYAKAEEPTRRMKGTIEADETWVGGKRVRLGDRALAFENKTSVVSLVKRGGGVRSFVVPLVSAQTLRETLLENIHPSSNLITDDHPGYKTVGKQFGSHETVNHTDKEYVRGDVYTNTVEGFFSLLKRGINGVYHHVSKEHLHRYLAEFDFRYNARKVTDAERTASAVQGFEGKRLMYKDSLSSTRV